MLETLRHEAVVGGEAVVLEVRQLPAVQALRLANRLGAIVSQGIASITSSKLAWLTDEDFEHVQRTVLSRVGVRKSDGTIKYLDFDRFMIESDAETVLELLWVALKGNYPKSFSRALGALSDPAGLVELLKRVLPSALPAVAAGSAPSVPETKPQPQRPGVQTLKPSAY